MHEMLPFIVDNYPSYGPSSQWDLEHSCWLSPAVDIADMLLTSEGPIYMAPCLLDQ